MSKAMRSAAYMVILALFLSGSPPLSGQARKADPSHRGLRGGLSVGYSTLDLDQLNLAVAQRGIHFFDERQLSVGLTSRAFLDRWIFGVEGNLLIDGFRHSLENTITTRLSSVLGFLNFGYLLSSQGGLEVYPLVGIGTSRSTVQIYHRLAEDFDEILLGEDAGTGTRFQTSGVLLTFSMAMDQAWTPGEQRRPGQFFGGYFFSLRLGYTVQLGRTTWRLNGLDAVEGGPEMKLDGLFLRASIGGWGDNNVER